MKYLFINFDNEKYWLEIGIEGKALRQIIIDNVGKVHVSCLEDCLAEGIINENELEGEISSINRNEFEDKWDIYTLEERKKWLSLKNNYSIGEKVECKVKYSYPQGWIVDLGQLLGVCKYDSKLLPNEIIQGTIIGYDEVNMWIIIKLFNSQDK